MYGLLNSTPPSPRSSTCINVNGISYMIDEQLTRIRTMLGAEDTHDHLAARSASKGSINCMLYVLKVSTGTASNVELLFCSLVDLRG